MSDNFKNILFLLFVLALGGLGYYLYTQQGTAILNINENEQVAENLRQETAAFITSLNTIQRIELDTTVFDDPRFTSLRSYNTPVPELEVGRENPFQIDL